VKVIKNDIDQKQAKIWEQQEILEDSEKSHLIDLTDQLEYQTQKVKDLQGQVDELSTQLATVNEEFDQSKAQAEMTSTRLHAAWEREVKRVAFLENRMEILREASTKLSAYPEALLKSSRDELLKAMGETINSARTENAVLSVGLNSVTAERDQAIYDSKLWESRYRELRDIVTKKAEEISKQQALVRKQENEISRLEIVLDTRTDEHNRLDAEKDHEIYLLNENKQLLRERLNQIVRLKTTDQVISYLDFKDEELQDVKDRLDAALAKIEANEYFLATIQDIHHQDVQLEHLNNYHAQDREMALRMTEKERDEFKDQLPHAEQERDRLRAQITYLQQEALPTSQLNQVKTVVPSSNNADHDDDGTMLTLKAIEEGRPVATINSENSPISLQQQDEASIEADRQLAEELQATLYMSQLEQTEMELPAAEDSDHEDEETIRAFNATEEGTPAPRANSENNLAGWEPQNEASVEADQKLAETLQAEVWNRPLRGVKTVTQDPPVPTLDQDIDVCLDDPRLKDPPVYTLEQDIDAVLHDPYSYCVFYGSPIWGEARLTLPEIYGFETTESENPVEEDSGMIVEFRYPASGIQERHFHRDCLGGS
jgi:hypothetical protein